MTKTYGIKISRPGFDVKTAQPNELSFSSQYKTLKVHASGSGSLTDSSRTVTIPHNLGYVPLFMVHNTMDAGFGGNLFSSSDYVLSPAGLGGVLADPSVGVNDDLFAYADSTNLYIKAQENFGYIVSDIGSQSSSNAIAWESSVAGYFAGSWGVGNNSGYLWSGANRFENVKIDQGTTIAKAVLSLYISSRSGTGEVKMRVYGIDEDNTVGFDSGTAGTARSKTTAYVDSTSNHSTGSYESFEVTSLVQEILNRVGWSNGNYLGFIENDNGTTASNTYSNDSNPQNNVLKILLNNTIASYKYTIFKNQLE